MSVVALKIKEKPVHYTVDDLRLFEEEIASLFHQGKIKSPIHLAGGNEQILIDIFRDIREQDWIFCGWRSHLHCLLKGVPQKELKEAILVGQSVSLCFPEYRIFSSGIVGGIAPIAVGMAWHEKKFGSGRVHVFLGDMAFESGIVHESIKYATGHDLRIKWYVEDNGKSVMTPTQESWGTSVAKPDILRYHYELTRPHSGINKWVDFSK